MNPLLYCTPPCGFLQDLTIDGEERPFYEDDENSDSEVEKDKEKPKPKAAMDPDHRLLLKNSKPLLQSRNAAVSRIWYCIYNSVQ